MLGGSINNLHQIPRNMNNQFDSLVWFQESKGHLIPTQYFTSFIELHG